MSCQIHDPESQAASWQPLPIPRSRHDIVNARVDGMRGYLIPENPVEEVLIDQTLLGTQFVTELAMEPDINDPKWCSKYRLAQSIFHKNLGTLDRRRKPAKAEKKAANAGLSRDEMLALEQSTYEPPEPSPEEIAEAAREWREAVAVVPEINREFPLLLKTRRVTEWYLSLASDGLTDRQILRLDPRIDYADLAAIRACEAAKLNGPFDPFGQLPADVPILPLARCPTFIPPLPISSAKAARMAALGTKPVPGWE